MTTLVLASQSPARLATLRSAGIEPVVIVSGVDEDQLEGLPPAELALQLAELKCAAVAARDDVPEIAAAARRCMGAVFATIQRTGWDDEQARDFVAYGMLLNVMMSMHAPEHLEPGDPLTALADCAFGAGLTLLQTPR